MEHAGALVSATLANINKKPGSPPFKTSDFMVNGFDSDNEDKTGANELERLLVTW